jgi:hypothetical protein
LADPPPIDPDAPVDDDAPDTLDPELDGIAEAEPGGPEARSASRAEGPPEPGRAAAPTSPEAEPEPAAAEPEAPPPAAAPPSPAAKRSAMARVRLTGTFEAGWLRDQATGDRHALRSPVPPGRYDVMVRFPGRSGFLVAETIDLSDGRSVVLRCDPDFQRCVPE